VKQIKNEQQLDIKILQNFVSEVQLMSKITTHPNVVKLIGVCMSPTLFMVMEFLEKGSLWNLLQSSTLLNIFSLVKIATGCAEGLNHLHKEGIIHRDIAARNILLTKDLIPKISDFGFARVITTEDGGKTSSDVGSLKWMSPESIHDRLYSKQSDIWSFGILLIEIFSRLIPYPDLNAVEVATRINKRELSPSPPNNSPKEIANLIISCCKFESKDRISITDICNILISLLSTS